MSNKIEILDRIIRDVADGESKSILVRRVNESLYDKEILYALVDSVIKLSAELETHTYRKVSYKDFNDMRKSYTIEPQIDVTKTTGVNESPKIFGTFIRERK